MYQRFYENSLIHKARGTCDYERAKINRLLRTFKELGLYRTSELDKNSLNRLILTFKDECSNKTANKMILITKQAFKFNDIDFKYLQEFKKLREEKRRFQIIETQGLKKIMNYIATSDITIANNLLYHSFIVLMLETGVRASELVNIEIKNINIQERYILLTTTKTKRDRLVFFTSLSERYIKMLINKKPQREKLLYNFLKKRDAKTQDIKYLIDKLKKELDIEKLHPHMFRHTFATLSYNNGMDIFVLKELLGHENLATTQIYTHLSQNKLKQAYCDTFRNIKAELGHDMISHSTL